MKTYYKNNLKQAFLIIEGEDSLEQDFQVFMLQGNEIPGLLKTIIKYIDNMTHYHYDVSGMTSLQEVHEKTKLSGENIKGLIQSLLHTVKEVQKYMLDGAGILLDPEYIYCQGESYFFCYYPPSKEEPQVAFHRLTEFFVREVDYKDKEGVHLAYTLHKATMEEHYSIEKIMDVALNDEPVTLVRYKERIEDGIEKETESQNMIAEKKSFWEQMKGFLDQRRQEKWGGWSESAKEETDL